MSLHHPSHHLLLSYTILYHGYSIAPRIPPGLAVRYARGAPGYARGAPGYAWGALGYARGALGIALTWGSSIAT